ncbi:MAG: hypothetical protein A2908_01825 [Candidatus Staskawiczbacteria bacterium RIFCSPLOWO2_01_FULL_38_12b]|uniref:Uncharacterized protein n=1 Tax=Candidatus Staskawiczbacteria bacterium RIFCSPLOWO2_01_FULL_38_12b TaxID=1802214 RepID=A0A1G2IE77_9BACT|nr:MAG: hypothetical protein A2908_01825 [Candidatus Staskawiczbacteria bacterium RIFCSPLOWO2_01_FULL_38_12b]QBM02596.1 hypothetical protein [uncultured archaeon]
MAIVFISPKKRQRMFFGIMMVSLFFIFIAISLVMFLPELINKNKNIPPDMSFDQPDVVINFKILDSEKVKALEPFTRLETEFDYIVQDQDDQQMSGTILAATNEDAQKLLEKSGYRVLMLKEVNLGRSEPFVSY